MEESRQIENLIYRYAELIDDGNLEEVAELFRNAEIVSTVHGMRREGFDEVLQMYRSSCRIYETTGTPLTKHLTTNVIIELDEDGKTASARSYYTVFQQTDELPLQPIIAGHYHDTFHRVGGQWCFDTREMFVDLTGDLSHHLLFEL